MTLNKKTILLHILSLITITLPNLIYIICNNKVFKETHYLALTMIAMLVLAIIGLGALIHFKVKTGVWITILGIVILVMSNISYVAGIALIIEGICLTLDSLIFKPLITAEKIKELEANGKSVTYTKQID